LAPLNLTQQELADAIGVTRVRVNEIILGKRSITPDTAFRLAKLFNTTADFGMALQVNFDMWETLQSNKTECARIRPVARKAA
jgi:addiction module HigA family antidote